MFYAVSSSCKKAALGYTFLDYFSSKFSTFSYVLTANKLTSPFKLVILNYICFGSEIKSGQLCLFSYQSHKSKQLLRENKNCK